MLTPLSWDGQKQNYKYKFNAPANHSFVVGRSCKILAVADATTILRLTEKNQSF